MVGPVFAPIRALNNGYGSGGMTMGSAVALVNVNAVANVNVAAAVNAAVAVNVAAAVNVVAAVAVVVAGVIIKNANYARPGDNARTLQSRTVLWALKRAKLTGGAPRADAQLRRRSRSGPNS